MAPLREFLASLGADPVALGEFILDPDAAMETAELPEDDRAALRSGFPAVIFARLSGTPTDEAFGADLRRPTYPSLVFPSGAAWPQQVTAPGLPPIVPPQYPPFPVQPVFPLQFPAFPPVLPVQPVFPLQFPAFPPVFPVQPVFPVFASQAGFAPPTAFAAQGFPAQQPGFPPPLQWFPPPPQWCPPPPPPQWCPPPPPPVWFPPPPPPVWFPPPPPPSVWFPPPVQVPLQLQFQPPPQVWWGR